MSKYKRYDYSQSMMIPVFFEEQLMPGTLEFAIHTLVQTRMDMSIFDDNYQNDETGRRAYDPKILLKVVLFAYSRGLISFFALDGVKLPSNASKRWSGTLSDIGKKKQKIEQRVTQSI